MYDATASSDRPNASGCDDKSRKVKLVYGHEAVAPNTTAMKIDETLETINKGIRQERRLGVKRIRKRYSVSIRCG